MAFGEKPPKLVDLLEIEQLFVHSTVDYGF